jgi:oxygen-independent coproporphyrinogen-3 oxidase
MLDFKIAGINRISTGIQALNDNDLKILGRRHSKKEAINAMNLIPQIYDNYSFDFIYARPNQEIKSWEDELINVIKTFDIKHISAYSLAIEKGTDFFTRFRNGEISVPEQSLQELFYLKTREILFENNIKQYEVSNYAIEKHKCIHNLGYWQLKDYIGIGPGAHGRVTLNDGTRYETMCHHKPDKWIKSIIENLHGLQKCKPISKNDQVNEIFIMGLRSYHGIDIDYIKSKFSIDIMSLINKGNLQKLIDENLIIINDQKIVPTENGICMINGIVKFLL